LRIALIVGVRWFSELVEVARGIDIFADRRHQGAAKNRIVTAEEVVAREPDLIIGPGAARSSALSGG
jgi:iron complex transport system substrate-binding protein